MPLHLRHEVRERPPFWVKTTLILSWMRMANGNGTGTLTVGSLGPHVPFPWINTTRGTFPGHIFLGNPFVCRGTIFSYEIKTVALRELGNHWSVGENEQTLWSWSRQNYENLWLNYSHIGVKSLGFASLSWSPFFAIEWLCDLGQVHALVWALISPFVKWWWQ